ncbi:MAG: class II fructose-bisphosphate aldolase [Candidatus Didemnitutus sp.]|nr:class II fructose-bisphosphate aldolase [Candidatus Didemnitutus sp.]
MRHSSSLATALSSSRARGAALLAVNVFDFESLSALAREFSNRGTPVIAQFSARFFSLHEPTEVVAWKRLVARNRLWLHLDHCADHALFRRCVRAGFDSVMFDGSGLPLQENIRESRSAVRIAHRLRGDVLVECEIGHVAGVEDGMGSDHKQMIPALEDVVSYYHAVQPDTLAVGFGNMHGHYRGNEHFDLELMRQVAHALPRTPLVLHGGSGMDLKIVRRLVCGGHCKLNISTDLKVAWMDVLKSAAQAGSPLEACGLLRVRSGAFFRGLRRKYRSILPD